MPVFILVVLRITQIDAFHDLGQFSPMSCCFHYYVHVVGHQDIVIKLKKEFLFAPENNIDTLMVIGLFLKDVLSVVAPKGLKRD